MFSRRTKLFYPNTKPSKKDPVRTKVRYIDALFLAPFFSAIRDLDTTANHKDKGCAIE